MARIQSLLTLALCALVICAVVAPATARRHRGGNDGAPRMDDETREVLEDLKPALDACKDQAKTLCPAPERPSGRRLKGGKKRGPPARGPAHAVLCLEDNVASLTGDCATTWAAVPAEAKSEAMEHAEDRLSPRAYFKRVCKADVHTKCSDAANKDDIITCLANDATVSDDCKDVVEEVQEHMEEHAEDPHHESHEYGHDVPTTGDGPSVVTSTMSLEQFNAIDEYEEGYDDDHDHHGPPVWAIAAGAAGLVAVIALVVVAVVVVRRRRSAARRVSMPTFELMPQADNHSVGSAGVPVGSTVDYPMADDKSDPPAGLHSDTVALKV